jgi:hypothetical protein
LTTSKSREGELNIDIEISSSSSSKSQDSRDSLNSGHSDHFDGGKENNKNGVMMNFLRAGMKSLLVKKMFNDKIDVSRASIRI